MKTPLTCSTASRRAASNASSWLLAASSGRKLAIPLAVTFTESPPAAGEFAGARVDWEYPRGAKRAIPTQKPANRRKTGVKAAFRAKDLRASDSVTGRLLEASFPLFSGVGARMRWRGVRACHPRLA